MKNFKLLALLWVILVSTTLVGCDNWEKDNIAEGNNSGDFIIEDVTWDYDAVIDYNDNLVDIASTCIDSANIAWEKIDSEESSVVDITEAINNAVLDCTNSINAINKLGDRDGDSSLKDGALTLLDKYIQYFTKFDELFKEEDEDKINEIYNEVLNIENELNEANTNLSAIQREFADSHDFTLESVEDYEELEATD